MGKFCIFPKISHFFFEKKSQKCAHFEENKWIFVEKIHNFHTIFPA